MKKDVCGGSRFQFPAGRAAAEAGEEVVRRERPEDAPAVHGPQRQHVEEVDHEPEVRQRDEQLRARGLATSERVSRKEG